jgi:uncharacterized RDD family membrane protein YckC
VSGASSPPAVDRSVPNALLPSSLVFADTPSRIVAYLLDGLVVGAVDAIPLAIFGFYDVGYPRFPDRAALVGVSLVVWVFQIAYFVWFWTRGRRATPGQRVFSIQVGNAFDGQPLSTRQALIRYLGQGSWISLPVLLPFRALAIAALVVQAAYLLVLLLSVVVSPTKQGLHDRLAGSAVVRPAHAERVWAKRVIWVLLAIVVFYVLLFALVFSTMPNGALPAGYWDSYLDWLWPS